MRIKFLREEVYETEGPGQGVTFRKGAVVDCADEFGERWLRREAVELVSRSAQPPAGKRWISVAAAKPTPEVAPKAAPAKPEGKPAVVRPPATPPAGGGRQRKRKR